MLVFAKRMGKQADAIDQGMLRVLLLSAWFGSLTGFTEALILTFKMYFLNRITASNSQSLWIAPLSSALLFMGVGAFLFAAGRLWKQIAFPSFVAAVFAFLAFLSFVSMVPGLHSIAKLLLSLGLAIQFARFVTLRGFNLYRITSRMTIWIVTFILALAIGMRLWQAAVEWRAIKNLPPTKPGSPNVLLITLDTVRAQSLSLYGYSRRTTPRLEELARRGVRFERAFSASSWTLPSHAAMFTGRSHHELSVGWFTPLDRKHPTLAEVLTSQGYLTAGFVANTEYCGYSTGLGRGFLRYEDYQPSLGQIAQGSILSSLIINHQLTRRALNYHDLLGRKTAPELNHDFLTWLSANNGLPFFVFLNYYDAHEPFMPPPPYETMFGTTDARTNPDFSPREDWSESEIRQERDAYDGSIAYLDQHLGSLFEQLQARGLLENTLVVITSDHGEEFNEHRIMGHGYNLYLTSLHVPLVIIYPGHAPADKVVHEPVDLQALSATIIDLLNLNGDPRLPGESLARHWSTSSGGAEKLEAPLLSELNFAPGLPASFPVSKGDMKSLIMGRYHYIKNGDGSEELYDFETDPAEQSNLIGSGAGQATAARLRVSLSTILSNDKN
jgi:arylsulfatase A-like enzyme